MLFFLQDQEVFASSKLDFRFFARAFALSMCTEQKGFSAKLGLRALCLRRSVVYDTKHPNWRRAKNEVSSMKTHPAEEQPPDPRDLEGWRQAVKDERLGSFRKEAVIAAIQDLGPNADEEVIGALARYVSDEMMRVLRRHIGINHRNKGDDIIEEAHSQLIEALLKPGSADGKGLREAFVPRIRYRAADAIRAEQKRQTRERSVQNVGEVSDAKHADNIGQKSQ